MALNSFVTQSGGEIGRAQAVQAEAAGVEATVEMNPILLKPEGPSRSQVIVMGRPLATVEARNYYANRAALFDVVRYALDRLALPYGKSYTAVYSWRYSLSKTFLACRKTSACLVYFP